MKDPVKSVLLKDIIDSKAEIPAAWNNILHPKTGSIRFLTADSLFLQYFCSAGSNPVCLTGCQAVNNQDTFAAAFTYLYHDITSFSINLLRFLISISISVISTKVSL